MITLTDVAKNYTLKSGQAIPAVHGINLKVEQGEFMVITGRSGSGKTTLLNLIAGLTRPTSGQILIDDVPLWNLSDSEQSLLRNRKMGFVFQFSSLLPSLTALENVALPTIFGDGEGKRDAYVRAAMLLADMGLSDKLSAYPRHLSAGQQQRVVIARALINHPELLLADEPTSNLDEQTEQEIMFLLGEIHKTRGITIVMVTHTSQLVSYGTHAIEMVAGMIDKEELLITNG